MQYTAPKFQEEYSAKLPALALLTQLGWHFMPPNEALAAREGKQDQVVLREVLRQELSKRRFTFAGQEHPLSEKSIDKLITEVCSPALNEGLVRANERMYNHLLYGISVTEFVEGKKTSPTIALIDWQNPANNSFVFTEEFTVTRANGVDNRRPDILCFVNGIPLVVIEAKRPDGQKGPTVNEGISQSLRNQRPDEVPHLFAYSQLLLSINGSEGRYGTCGTPEKFWAAWREEEGTELQLHALKNRLLTHEQKDRLFNHRKPSDRQWYENLIAGGELLATGQDQLLASLLEPQRLLDMVRYFTLFDKKAGKIVARYHQVFGIKALIERIKTQKPDGAREGGVIWHTTGSGKSLTMVFLSKTLILHQDLQQCRIVIITDRVDLESQLSATFASSGELSGKKDKEAAMATTGRRLAEQIATGRERIIFSLIQKFNSATKLPECVNTSPDIIVLIDEGHRSQGGENNIRMRQALPKASFVAFTGTPLLKDDKTENKFGKIVHAYTMQRAVEDKTVTPLLYEERIPDLDVNERAIDAWFERITQGLTDEQKADLKRKFARKGAIYSAEDRIRLIALDVVNHFTQNIDDELNGQLACDSKASAIQYKAFLDEAQATLPAKQRFESAVIMSPPDTREGNTAVDESSVPVIAQWWKDNVGAEDEQAYTKRMIARFAEPQDPLRMLIVVDKLLTGFDEPKNTVLYIDKPLKEHNLIQAIARVNRLHPKKEFGLLIDYRGILAELDTTLGKYQDLASRTQGGYDIDDIQGLYEPMSTEYKRLPHLYKVLWAIFEGVKNTQDMEQLKACLIPRIEERNGELLDSNQKRREDFYEALSHFASCLKVALQSASFFEDKSFTEADRRHYKETVKQLSSLRLVVKQACGEQVDYDAYAEQVKKLLDKHVVGIEIRESEGVYEIGKMGQVQPQAEWSDDKTRNETDIIKTRVTRMIEQELQDDPYAQEAFSVLLRQAIEEAERLFEHPMKQYLLFQAFAEKVEQRRLDEIPDAFQGNRQAQAYFGVFKKVLPHVFDVMDAQVQKKWVGLAFKLDEVVTQSVAEHSINPQNIEADIRKQLLPMMFKETKAVGAGMDQAKKLVELVVQITRVGLNGI